MMHETIESCKWLAVDFIDYLYTFAVTKVVIVLSNFNMNARLYHIFFVQIKKGNKLYLQQLL